jgi:hypothetical protein
LVAGTEDFVDVGGGRNDDDDDAEEVVEKSAGDRARLTRPLRAERRI